MVFHWSLSNSKSPQSILAVLNNVVVWMVSTRPPIIIIIIIPWKFFTSVLADGLSLNFEWPQDSSSLQDSSQYSGCSQ